MRFSDLKQMTISDLNNVTDFRNGHWRGHNLHLQLLLDRLIPKKYHPITTKIVYDDIFGCGHVVYETKKGLIWTSRPFNGQILKKELRGESSGSNNYDRVLVNDLVKANVLIEFRYGRHGHEYISFFTYIRQFTCWKYLYENAVLSPECVIKIAKSYAEVVNKIARICRRDNKCFDQTLIEIRFAEFLSDTLVKKMAPSLQSGIIPSYKSVDSKRVPPVEFILKTFIPILEAQNPTEGWDPTVLEDIPQDVAELILRGSQQAKRKFVSTEEYSPEAENMSDDMQVQPSRFFCPQDDFSLNKKVLSEPVSLNNEVLSEVPVTQQKSVEWQGSKKSVSSVSRKGLRNRATGPIDTNKSIDNISFIDSEAKKENTSSKEDAMYGMDVLEAIQPKGDKSLIGKKRKPRPPSDGPKEVGFRSREKQHDILTESGFIEYYQDRLYHKFFKNSGERLEDFKLTIQYESDQAAKMLDVLYAAGARDEMTLKAWVEWYLKQLEFKNLRRKFNKFDFSVSAFLKSWKKYAPQRPKEYPALTGGFASTKTGPHNDIFDDLMSTYKMKSANQEQKISIALGQYGVVIVGSYLEKLYSRPAAETAISTFLNNHASDHDMLTKIYSATRQFMCDYVKKHAVVLKDWEERFSSLWLPAKDMFAEAEAFQHAGHAEEYFAFMEFMKGKKI